MISKTVIDNGSIDEIARYIRPCIGLTKGQAQANLKYYNNIVNTLKEEHPKMKPESIHTKAREASAKYAERQHRQRALTIAQTEMATAYNKGADESIKQAQAQHLIGTVKKRWCTSGDDAVCTRCSSLEGVEIDMYSKFAINARSTGEGLTPPAHPRCACAVEYIEVNHIIFPSPNPEENQEYRPVVRGESEIVQVKPNENTVLRRVNSYQAKIYVSDEVNIKPKALHTIYIDTLKALDKWNIPKERLPEIIVVAPEELRAFGRYDAFNNIVYYIPNVLNDDGITIYHEMWHMKQAEKFRARGWIITKENYGNYLEKLCNECKKTIDDLEIDQYNVDKISRYASMCYKAGRYDEVEAEYMAVMKRKD